MSNFQIHYILHSGFMAETPAACYLFDYYKGPLPLLDKNKPVVVFASHFHQDHYNPEVFSLLKAQGAASITAVLANDISRKRYPEGIETITLRPRETCVLPGGETVETLRSTDSGVAFLLTTPYGVLYHAGDLNDWTWAGEPEADNKRMRTNYRAEIDKLTGRTIDTAFVPLDPRQEEDYAAGMVYFLEHTNAAEVWPMHYWEQPGVMDRFAREYPQYRSRVRRTE